MKQNSIHIEIDNPEKLLIVLPRKANYLIVVPFGIWCLGYLGITSVFFYNLISNLNRVGPGQLMLIMAMILVGLFVTRIFLWQARGVERIELSNGSLSIQKIGAFWPICKRYELSEIAGFEVVNGQPFPWFLRTYWMLGGQIEFYYYGNRILFGQTLTASEANELMALLGKKLKEQKNNT